MTLFERIVLRSLLYLMRLVSAYVYLDERMRLSYGDLRKEETDIFDEIDNILHKRSIYRYPGDDQ